MSVNIDENDELKKLSHNADSKTPKSPCTCRGENVITTGEHYSKAENTDLCTNRYLGYISSTALSMIVLILLIIFGAPIITPSFLMFRQGFFCDDRSIQYFYLGDTVTNAMLCVSVVIPPVIFLAVEWMLCRTGTLKRAIVWWKEYAAGAAYHLLIVFAIKNFIGELRPDFIDQCKPDKFLNCTDNRYITDYVCTNDEIGTSSLLNASLSFPSGHASISFYEAIFTIYYLQFRLKRVNMQKLLTFMHSLCFMWACFCSISRITDNRHHWWDVLAGASFGCLAAILTCLLRYIDFKRKYTVVTNSA